MDVLCDYPNYPNDIGNSEIKPPNPWPICVPLECVCLGDESLSIEEALNITQKSCPSFETVSQNIDVSNRTYTVPKREHCGTFKPEDPTYENKCTCPDLDPGNFR